MISELNTDRQHECTANVEYPTNLLHHMTTICLTIFDAFTGSMHHTLFPLNFRLHYPGDWRLPGTKH